jgi:putative nucleotidyltransferase with HDIG domain
MVFVKPDDSELEQVQAILSPEQMVLFMQMQPGEKNHALTMYHRLLEQGEDNPDLIVAALLHDVGKTHYPMNPMERTMVVLARVTIPAQAHKWGNPPTNAWEKLPGWRKPFVVAEQHAAWGAELAHETGVSSLTETLIRKHHHPNTQVFGDEENILLYKLWVVDNDS